MGGRCEATVKKRITVNTKRFATEQDVRLSATELNNFYKAYKDCNKKYSTAECMFLKISLDSKYNVSNFDEFGEKYPKNSESFTRKLI